MLIIHLIGLEPGSRAPLFRAMDADRNQYPMREDLVNRTGVLILCRGYRSTQPKQHFTYIIHRDEAITWRQFDPDNKKRSGFADMLKALLQQKKLPGS